MKAIDNLYTEAVQLLKALIETPSFSKEEARTADILESWLLHREIPVKRSDNNVWAINQHYDASKPNILLNSHHDTVKPNKKYTKDPFKAIEEGGKIYGLGSNDAGGCLVSLLALFVNYYKQEDLNYNLIIAITAEEEISGDNGLRSILPALPTIDFAIVGEPTQMQLAVSEKGLLVIDAYAEGVSGHAAHDNTINAISEAIKDIEWINTYKFPKTSATLGEVKMSVTQIKAGTQHNVVPASCHFVIDVRFNDRYTNKEVYDYINQHTKSKMIARSFKHNSSSIVEDHPIVLSGIKLGRSTYGSSTLSDQTVLNCDSLKLGPGVSSRSHTADEFIYLQEIKEGIELYIKIIEPVLKNQEI